MLHRQLYNPRNQIGAPHHQLQNANRMYPNPYSPQNYARSDDPTARDKARQEQLQTNASEYKSNGKVQVVPKITPAPSAAPSSWPVIPPAYVPRAGTLVMLPWEQQALPDTRPLTQTNGKPPKLYRSARSQMNSFNNLYIDNRGLDMDPVDALTSGKDWTTYDTTKYLSR